MFRLGRCHARLTEWHKVHVGAVNAAIHAVLSAPLRGVADSARRRGRVAVHRVVAHPVVAHPIVVVAADRVMHRASRTRRSLSVASKSRVVRPFARC